MFLVRNMKVVAGPLAGSAHLDDTSRRQLRFIGALVGCSVPLGLAIAAYFCFPMALLLAFLAYAGLVGGVVGAWRAPAAVRAEAGEDEAGKAAAAGVVLGTALLTGGSIALLLVQNPSGIEMLPLIGLGGLLVGLVLGTAIGYPSALVSVWLLRRSIREP